MKVHDITIAHVLREDIPQISRIEREATSQPWSEQGFLDAVSQENVIFLTAKEQGVPVGYCGMYCAADEGEITNVAVAKGYRGRGIGRLLMEQLLETAAQNGIATVILEVRVSNQGAIALYQGLGFNARGIRKNFYQKPLEDALVMGYSQ